MLHLDEKFQQLSFAVEKCGAQNKEIKVIAVSKKQEEEKLLEYCRYFEEKFHSTAVLGENYLDALEKRVAWAQEQALQVEWHFLGALQSRKLKRVLELSDVLHSVCREKELKIIAESKKNVQFFIQVNISKEANKNGLLPSELESFLATEVFLALKGQCLGLMGVASDSSEEKVSSEFSLLKELRDRLLPGAALNMGMSGDYELALKADAQYLRLGSYFFGARVTS